LLHTNFNYVILQVVYCCTNTRRTAVEEKNMTFIFIHSSRVVSFSTRKCRTTACNNNKNNIIIHSPRRKYNGLPAVHYNYYNNYYFTSDPIDGGAGEGDRRLHSVITLLSHYIVRNTYNIKSNGLKTRTFSQRHTSRWARSNKVYNII